jgi:hypothetical protein
VEKITKSAGINSLLFIFDSKSSHCEIGLRAVAYECYAFGCGFLFLCLVLVKRIDFALNVVQLRLGRTSVSGGHFNAGSNGDWGYFEKVEPRNPYCMRVSRHDRKDSFSELVYAN